MPICIGDRIRDSLVIIVCCLTVNVRFETDVTLSTDIFFMVHPTKTTHLSDEPFISIYNVVIGLVRAFSVANTTTSTSIAYAAIMSVLRL